MRAQPISTFSMHSLKSSSRHTRQCETLKRPCRKSACHRRKNALVHPVVGPHLWRLEPRRASEPPDWQLMVAIVSRGHGSVPVGDYASRCTEYTKTNCIRKAVDPEVGVRLIGWAVLTPP